MRLRIGECERRAPGAAEHLPALDLEMLAELLDVVDEMPGGVFLDAGCGGQAPASALIEEDNGVARRIVIAAHHRGRAAARAAMQQHRWLAVRVAAFLVIELVQGRDLEPPGAIGNDFWVKAQAAARLRLALIHGEAILHDFRACWERRLLPGSCRCCRAVAPVHKASRRSGRATR